MAISSIQLRLLFFSSLLIIFSGCSLFKAGQKDNRTGNKISLPFQKSSDIRISQERKKTPPVIYTDIDFFSADTTDQGFDTTFYYENISYADSLLRFSNERLNDDIFAGELVSGSLIAHLLDSLVHLQFFRDSQLLFDRSLLNIYNYPEDYVPLYTDSVYAARISALNIRTPLELTYNKTVRGFIELYGVRKRGLTQRILGLAELYFPMFEETLDRMGLPLELKYLAVVESALNPLAVSPAGARGIWQFMYHTGKRYGLEVNSYVDDRHDPLKATIAACQHLKDLYDIYKDWWLVMAAYNAGPGNVNKAIRRAGNLRNYWAIWPYLPAETRGYVPAFIAVLYLMNHTAEHNLYPIHPGILYHEVDTLHIKNFLTFEQISAVLGISIENLRYLNPQFKEGVIPATPDNIYVLRLPRELSGYFITREKEIYSHKTEKTLEKEKLAAIASEPPQVKIHTVKSGETLSSIARKYNTTVANLQAWNRLKGTTIHPGQKLTVQAPSRQSGATGNTSTTTASSSTPSKSTVHIVKSGESLGMIASRYNCSVDDLKKWNNLTSDVIFPNQRLTVRKPDSHKTSAPPIEGQKVIFHTVKQGETLWGISRQYNVSVEELKRLNNIRDSNSLKVGQRLKIEIKS